MLPYVGIAVVSGVSALIGSQVNGVTEGTSFETPTLIGGSLYVGYSLYTNLDPNYESPLDSIVNRRSHNSSSSHEETEIETIFDFNNLIIQ